MNVLPPLLRPVDTQVSPQPLTPVQSSGVSLFTIAILAGVGYGGYRLYKHFKKG